MKKVKVFFMTTAVTVFTLLAQIGAASACHASWYQPKLPKSLQKY